MGESVEKTDRRVVFWIITAAVIIASLTLWAFISSLSRTLESQPSKDEIPLKVELL